MKSHLPLALFITIGTSALASPVQYIDCHNSTLADTTHVLLSFTDTQTGSFSVMSTNDPVSTSSSNDQLNLTRQNFTATATTANFTSTSGNVTFTYQMPAATVMQAAASFSASLTTDVASSNQTVVQPLTCLAKMN